MGTRHRFDPMYDALSGEGGIRTHGTRKGTLDFESSAFDHSATSPQRPQKARVADRTSLAATPDGVTHEHSSPVVKESRVVSIQTLESHVQHLAEAVHTIIFSPLLPSGPDGVPKL